MVLLKFLRNFAVVWGLLLSGCTTPSGELGIFTVDDGRGAIAASMNVYFYKPPAFKPDGPVLIVVHGLSRNVAGYRNYFTEVAERYGALILAPEFNRENFQGSRRFNLGNLKNSLGDDLPQSQWSFPIIDRVFDQVNLGNLKNSLGDDLPQSQWSFPIIDRVFDQARTQLGFSQKRYSLFGHSAGSQFVHRMIMFSPSNKLIAAVAANAGWYTEPNLAIDFPYGLKNAPAEKKNLRRAFGQKLIIMLGQHDINETHRSLRRTDEANAQGSHRFARGKYFFQRSKEVAQKLGVPFAWRLREVPGVAHSGRGMAGPAGDVLLGAKSSK
ncbi:MAG: hypothetical protein GKS01_00855 [Alphaproteobacteria bacterium]|nr:hypothetical protein [Alphaproteobacteria bacterium]